MSLVSLASVAVARGLTAAGQPLPAHTRHRRHPGAAA
jgi:hypothetical protein